MNPWHDVDIGRETPRIVSCVVESPKQSSLKYEMDKKTGMLMLDRALYSAVYYPGNYGFIPQTYWDDNDPLDIIIVYSQPIYPLTIVRAKPVGVMLMEDSGESDDKIIAVLADDPRFSEINDIKDLPQHVVKEIKNFFETYKELQGKKVIVKEVFGAVKAHQTIERGIQLYKDKFS